MRRFPVYVFLFLSLVLLLQSSHLASFGGQQVQPPTLSPQVQPAPAQAPGPEVRADLDFGRMPLYFIANKGQLDERVAYYVRGQDKTIYFTSDGLVIVLSRVGEMTGDQAENAFAGRAIKTPINGAAREQIGEGGSPDKGHPERWVVKLDFIEANAEVKPIGDGKTESVISYFKGRPRDWKTGLPTYSKIVYRDLWPGIDLVYSGTVNRLKYEFILQPGADPSRIQLAYRGATGISITDGGRLEVTSPLGSFHDEMPVAYQEVGGIRQDVSLSYKLDGSHQERESVGTEKDTHGNRALKYGFEVGAYDPALPLILDPALFVYCGYIGGSGDDCGFSVAVDGGGSAYITGWTTSSETTFPVSVGPDQTYNGGTYDAFIAKVNVSGTALVYCDYIGGSDTDYGYGIAVDGSGNAYITGQTRSDESSFPVTTGPDLTYNGSNWDAFVAKVNASGTALVYCGYIGGSDDDFCRGIAVDTAGNAYVTGSAFSDEASFPVTVGPDLTYNGVYDGFVAKVNAAGTALSYCGYIGGSSFDLSWGIAVDGSGNAFVTGRTDSTEANFPVAVGPDLTSNGSGDAFVAKVNTVGTALDYCGYIGGSGSDTGYSIAVDVLGSAYVSGETQSYQPSFPVAVGPDLTYNGGSYDGFVAKVNAAGTALSYCGYIGGSGSEISEGMAVDGSGNSYVTGQTSSNQTTFPVVTGPDLTYGGNWDGFVARVNAAGSALDYCGYIGGSSVDVSRRIAVDGSGNAYVAGQTWSEHTTFPVAVGPDITHNGAYDAIVAKITYYEDRTPKHAVGDFDGDGADEAAVDFGATGIYLYDGGTWTQLSSANPESLTAADVDGDTVDELLADLGAAGLWLWSAGTWNQLSGVNADGMAAGDVDADGADEVVGDFGAAGMWLYNGGAWTQLSGVNVDYVASADLDGSGGEEIVGDFGATGLWTWNAGAWTQLSGVNADYVAFGDTNGLAGDELIGDFGATGLWLWSSGSGWTQLSGVNADDMIMGDIDGNGDDEIFGDFATTGLWLWDSGSWTQLSGVNADFMIQADVDGNGDDEVIGDFGATGLWLVNGGSWTQLSGVNAEYLVAGDVDGDHADEILADFGSLGLWLWNGGAWSQISANNPE